MTIRALNLLFAVALTLAAVIWAEAQSGPYAAQIQSAINNLTAGSITHGAIGMTGGAASATGFVSLGRTVVGSLPAAAAGNAGQIIQVTDSTAVAAEGQTCVGGNTNNALAFSTGTVWKCF